MSTEKLGIPITLGPIEYGTVLVTEIGGFTLMYEVQSAMERDFPIISVCRGSLCSVSYTSDKCGVIESLTQVSDERPFYNIMGGIFGTFSRNLSRFPTYHEQTAYDKAKHI